MLYCFFKGRIYGFGKRDMEIRVFLVIIIFNDLLGDFMIEIFIYLGIGGF